MIKFFPPIFRRKVLPTSSEWRNLILLDAEMWSAGGKTEKEKEYTNFISFACRKSDITKKQYIVSSHPTSFLFPVISVSTWTKLSYCENGCGNLAQNVGRRNIVIQHSVSTPEYRFSSNIWRVNIIISISTFVFRRRNTVFRSHFNIIFPWTTLSLKWSS